MDYIKFKVDEAKYLEIKDFYQAKLINDPRRPYDLFEVRTPSNVQVKAYSSKGQYTILFAGEKSEIELEALIFFKDAHTIAKKNTKKAEKWEDDGLQIGSDEVGVGDFFLGFFVCATCLDKEDIDYVDSLGVMDSKKMTDSKILEIGPALRERIKNHIVYISAPKLTELENKGWSTHKILANAHNLAHTNLIKQYNLSDKITIYIDQFERKEVYLRYAYNNKLKNPLVFQTKGESYYPSIAAASVLARYTFLKQWEEMEKKFGVTIPKGASKDVDKVYISLVKKFGQEALDPYVKRFFRNYKDREPKDEDITLF